MNRNTSTLLGILLFPLILLLAAACGGKVARISGVSGAGIRDVLRQLLGTIKARRQAAREAETAGRASVGWRP